MESQTYSKRKTTAPLSINDIALSPDGSQVVSSLVNDGDIMFCDISKAKLVGERIKGAAAGKMLASLSLDGHVILWDTRSHRKLGELGQDAARGISGDVAAALAFSPDGKKVAWSNYGGNLVMWDVDIESWLRRACSIANRNLTSEESNEWIPDYRHKICPN
jgi:WD40 repeat protein